MNDLRLPAWLTNPIALLRVFIPFVLVLGLLESVPSGSSLRSTLVTVADGLFTTVFVLSVLFLTLMLLDRPTAERSEPTAGLTDAIVDVMTTHMLNLPVFVVALGVLVAVVELPTSNIISGFFGWTADLAWNLALAVAFAAVVAALVGIVHTRRGGTPEEAKAAIVQPLTAPQAAAVLRDGTIVVTGLVLLAILLDVLDEVGDVFDGISGFFDTFEFGLWYLLALLTMLTVMLGLAWAIETRRDINDPAATTRLARNVPSTVTMFWDPPELLQRVPFTFGVVALGYVVANLLAWSRLGNSSPGLPAFDLERSVAVLFSDILWVALFGSIIVTVIAGIARLRGEGDDVLFLSLQGMYLVGAAASLAAIVSLIAYGSGYRFYDAVFDTLVFRWSLGACGIAGLVAVRALYWDRTMPAT